MNYSNSGRPTGRFPKVPPQDESSGARGTSCQGLVYQEGNDLCTSCPTQTHLVISALNKSPAHLCQRSQAHPAGRLPSISHLQKRQPAARGRLALHVSRVACPVQGKETLPRASLSRYLKHPPHWRREGCEALSKDNHHPKQQNEEKYEKIKIS